MELPNSLPNVFDDGCGDITYVAVNDGGDVVGYWFGDIFIRAISGGAESDGDDAGDGEGDGEEEGEDTEEESDEEEEDDEEEDEGEGKEKPKSKVKPKPKEKPDDKITLTEARLKSRLKRARDGSVRGLAKELGFDSVDELKAAIATKSGKSGGATKTRTEKGSDSGKSGDSADTDDVRRLRTDNAALSAKLRLNTLQVAVEREAAKMGFIDPEDAFRLVDFGDGEDYMDDKDKTDSEAIREALEELSKRKKHLLRSKTKTTSKSRIGDEDEDEDEEDDEDEDDVEEPKKVVKGRRAGSPSRNGNKTATAGEKELKRRFPILSGNVRIRG